MVRQWKLHTWSNFEGEVEHNFSVFQRILTWFAWNLEKNRHSNLYISFLRQVTKTSVKGQKAEKFLCFSGLNFKIAHFRSNLRQNSDFWLGHELKKGNETSLSLFYDELQKSNVKGQTSENFRFLFSGLNFKLFTFQLKSELKFWFLARTWAQKRQWNLSISFLRRITKI